MNLMIASMSLAGLACTLSASADRIFAIADMGDAQALVTFESSAPSQAMIVNVVDGLEPGEMILGLDQRPHNTKLYAVTSSSRLVTIDRHSAEVEIVTPGTFATGLVGTAFGFDFNPTIDRIRNVSDADQNLVLNPITGALQLVATPVFYPISDVNAGMNPNVVHHAYNNNVFGATASQLFAIDSNNDMLVKQANNAGTLTTVGELGVDFSDLGGFDIAASGMAYACSTEGCDDLSISRFYTIDLQSGAAQFEGFIATASGDLLRISAMASYSPSACPSDFNRDGVVDGSDLGWLLVGWLTGDDQMDTTDDGIVDGADWGNVMSEWGPCGQ
jgi:hypothetical protein